jgi:RHS repeat-associated protein
VQSSSGTWQGPFGYAGSFGYQEDPNGLKLLGHRYYDSSTGRFMTSDPAGHGRNWYSYAGNDPVSYVDPAGLMAAAVALYAVPGLGEILLVATGIAAICYLVYKGAEAAQRWFEGRTQTTTQPQPLPAPVNVGPTYVPASPSDTGDDRGYKPVYRLGEANGQWWSSTDPRTDPDYYSHHGMRKDKNPGTVVSTGFVRIAEVGMTWFPQGAKDWDGNPLNNGYDEIWIPDPGSTVKWPHEHPWHPGSFR